MAGYFRQERTKNKHHVVVNTTKATRKEWLQHILFFGAFLFDDFFSLTFLKLKFAPGAIPWADAFASATAYTGMWLMAKKKVESWYWWIRHRSSFQSIPLYFVKHYAFTSVYYLILLIMAFFGLMEWIKRARTEKEKVMTQFKSSPSI